MALREDLERQGNWLFKRRSYLPVLGVPIVVLALRHSEYLEMTFGEPAAAAWGLFCFCVSLFGLGIRCLTLGYVPRGTSGRNTQSQVADTLNTTGTYSFVRNPLYLGNFVIVMGVVLFIEVWWLALIVAVGFWMYYERIIFAEEEFLRKKFGSQFMEWAEHTPAFLPCFKNWKKPLLPFSFKAVLRKEFTTFFGIVAPFAFLDIAKGLLAQGKLQFSLMWTSLFVFSLLFYLTTLVLKKKTKVLNVAGR